MSRRPLCIALGAITPVCIAAVANAQFASIRTNANGADSELRESETNADAGGMLLGTNRGANTELAARAIDSVTVDAGGTTITNPFPTGDRSSVSLAKFDISGLPPQSDATFWVPEAKVQFRLYVRNANSITTGRLFGANPSDPTQEVNSRLRVRALNPAGVYGDDNPTAFNRTDRTGNNYTASQNKYNWDEAGVTFYNAPGITPHRINTNAGNVVETLGLYDDFNSDVLNLGAVTMRDFLQSGQTALLQGDVVIFDDDSLKNLVFAAQNANRTHVTLMFHLDNDTVSHQPGVGRIGVTPGNFLNFNYNFIPKEHINVSGTISNANGDYSPELRVVPEPASAALGLIGLAGLARRRRA